MRTTVHKLFLRASYLLTAILLMAMSSSAQDVSVSAELDSANILIGQQAKLMLSIRYRGDKGKHVKVEWPSFSDTLRKEIEIVSQSAIDTVIPDKNDPFGFVQRRTLFITSFDSGYWAIPPVTFSVQGDTTPYMTEPLLLQVGTVAVDTTLAIRDIKPPFGEEYTWLDWLKDNMWVVYAVIGGLILILLIIYLVMRTRRKPEPVVVPEAPKIPAHIIALEKLEKLKQDKLWQDGKLKQYHSALTDILREYIENRFRIQALEQTTEEIIFGFRHVAIDDESKAKLKQVLVLADLVKFAKELPLPNENELSMSYSFDFVNGTKREEPVTKPEQGKPDV